MSRRSPTSVAIIGTGTMAHWHARYLKKTRGCRVTACVDTHPERLKKFSRRYQIPETYRSTKELLQQSNIDAIAVVVPDPFHKPIALECIQHGKHILCEKPLALNYLDANSMTRAAPKTPTLQDRFIRSIRSGKAEQPDFVRGAEIQKLIDACFESNDLKHPVKVT